MEPGLNRLLHFYKSLGIRELLISPEMMDRLTPKSRSRPEEPATLSQLRRQWAGCTRCRLSESRTHLVFGEGDEHPDLVFVGEGPGRDEDMMGRPFVGKAGELLTKIIAAMGLEREAVYITNVVKCRPPRNRDPLPEEVAMCRPCLEAQLGLLQPKVLCTLGRISTHALLKTDAPISALRGRFHRMGDTLVMPTYHPAALLYDPAKKRDVWEDVQKIMRVRTTGTEEE